METNQRPILHNGLCSITRMQPYDDVSGLTLEDWTPSCLHEITLPPDAVLALLRGLPREMLQEALDGQGNLSGHEPFPLDTSTVWHWALRPGVPACGSDEPNQGLTPAPQQVTCPACLKAWHRLCQSQALLAMREA